MWTGSLIRLSGGALVLAAPILFITAIINPASYNPDAILTEVWVPVHLAVWIGTILTIFGLIGLHLSQAEESGRLGLIAFILLFYGYVVTAAAPAVEALALPALVAAQNGVRTVESLLFNPQGPLGLLTVVVGISFLLTSLGYILMGIAIIRAGVFPRPSGVLLIVAPLTSLAALIIPKSIFLMSVTFVGIVESALFWLGVRLLIEKRK